MARYLPDLFGENLMDDWSDWFSDGSDEMRNAMRPLYGHHAKNVMKTDVTEKDGNYEIAVDLPGFKKDEVAVSLENGYLTIETKKDLDKKEEDKKGNIIRQERYAGNMARSFYVGEDVKDSDISAKFEDGVLKITVPDTEKKEAVPEKKTIAIEG